MKIKLSDRKWIASQLPVKQDDIEPVKNDDMAILNDRISNIEKAAKQSSRIIASIIRDDLGRMESIIIDKV
jgi:hypothetical protein